MLRPWASPAEVPRKVPLARVWSLHIFSEGGHLNAAGLITGVVPGVMLTACAVGCRRGGKIVLIRGRMCINGSGAGGGARCAPAPSVYGVTFGLLFHGSQRRPLNPQSRPAVL